MQEINIQKLVHKFKAGTCSEQELSDLENWYLQWEPESFHIDGERLDAIMSDVWSNLPVVEQKRFTRRKQPVKIWTRIAAVAAIIIVTLSIWLYTFLFSDAGTGSSSAMYKSDVVPGKSTATLTLSNGKIIKLSDAKTGVVINSDKFTYNDGTEVEDQSTEKVVLGTIKTPRGGQYQIILPDGTHVWLNAASSIQFPSKFTGNTRMVTFTGEGYFEVSKDKKHPFIVVTDKQEVEVLGTHFNINAYENEGTIKTTLLEGAVKVLNLKSKISNVLNPGEQSQIRDEVIEIKNVNTEDAIAWKNGLFVFDNETLKSIMRKIERWYDVEVVYADENIGRQLFSGSVSRFEQVSVLLTQLENTGPVKFKIEGKKIIVMKPKRNAIF